MLNCFHIFQPDHTPRCATSVEKAVIGGSVPTSEKRVCSTSPSPDCNNDTPKSWGKLLKAPREIRRRIKAGSTYRSCVCWPHVTVRVLRTRRRRGPMLVVGSAARHVNACWLYIIRGILQLLPASVVHKLGSGDLWGPRSGKIGNC